MESMCVRASVRERESACVGVKERECGFVEGACVWGGRKGMIERICESVRVGGGFREGRRGCQGGRE